VLLLFGKNIFGQACLQLSCFLSREGSIPDSKYDTVGLLVRSLHKQALSGTVFFQQRSSLMVKSWAVIIIGSLSHTKQLQ